VIGIIVAVLVVAGIIWGIKKRQSGAGDRQSLIGRETGY
jgi:hypothetical protein